MSKKPKQYKPSKSGAKKLYKEKKYDRGKLYDKDWNSFRFRFLYYNKKCYVCGLKATVVDHIKAHKGDEELFQNQTNFMPCCKFCHDIITGKFDQYNPPRTKEKVRWIMDKRTQNKNFTRIVVIPYKKK